MFGCDGGVGEKCAVFGVVTRKEGAALVSRGEKVSNLRNAEFCKMMQEEYAIAYTCKTMVTMMLWKEKSMVV